MVSQTSTANDIMDMLAKSHAGTYMKLQHTIVAACAAHALSLIQSQTLFPSYMRSGKIACVNVSERDARRCGAGGACGEAPPQSQHPVHCRYELSRAVWVHAYQQAIWATKGIPCMLLLLQAAPLSIGLALAGRSRVPMLGTGGCMVSRGVLEQPRRR